MLECFCELHHPISAASDFYLRPRCALDLIRRCSVWSVDVHVMGPICQSLLFVLWEPWLFFSLQTIPFRFPLSVLPLSSRLLLVALVLQLRSGDLLFLLVASIWLVNLMLFVHGLLVALLLISFLFCSSPPISA